MLNNLKFLCSSIAFIDNLSFTKILLIGLLFVGLFAGLSAIIIALSFPVKFAKKCDELKKYVYDRGIDANSADLIDTQVSKISKEFKAGFDSFKSNTIGKPSDYISKSKVFKKNLKKSFLTSFACVYICLALFATTILGILYFTDLYDYVTKAFLLAVIVPVVVTAVFVTLITLYNKSLLPKYLDTANASFDDLMSVMDEKMSKGELQPSVEEVVEEEVKPEVVENEEEQQPETQAVEEVESVQSVEEDPAQSSNEQEKTQNDDETSQSPEEIYNMIFGDSNDDAVDPETKEQTLKYAQDIINQLNEQFGDENAPNGLDNIMSDIDNLINHELEQNGDIYERYENEKSLAEINKLINDVFGLDLDETMPEEPVIHEPTPEPVLEPEIVEPEVVEPEVLEPEVVEEEVLEPEEERPEFKEEGEVTTELVDIIDKISELDARIDGKIIAQNNGEELDKHEDDLNEIFSKSGVVKPASQTGKSYFAKAKTLDNDKSEEQTEETQETEAYPAAVSEGETVEEVENLEVALNAEDKTVDEKDSQDEHKTVEKDENETNLDDNYSKSAEEIDAENTLYELLSGEDLEPEVEAKERKPREYSEDSEEREEDDVSSENLSKKIDKIINDKDINRGLARDIKHQENQKQPHNASSPVYRDADEEDDEDAQYEPTSRDDSRPKQHRDRHDNYHGSGHHGGSQPHQTHHSHRPATVVEYVDDYSDDYVDDEGSSSYEYKSVEKYEKKVSKEAKSVVSDSSNGATSEKAVKHERHYVASSNDNQEDLEDLIDELHNDIDALTALSKKQTTKKSTDENLDDSNDSALDKLDSIDELQNKISSLSGALKEDFDGVETDKAIQSSYSGSVGDGNQLSRVDDFVGDLDDIYGNGMIEEAVRYDEVYSSYGYNRPASFQDKRQNKANSDSSYLTAFNVDRDLKKKEEDKKEKVNIYEDDENAGKLLVDDESLFLDEEDKEKEAKEAEKSEKENDIESEVEESEKSEDKKSESKEKAKDKKHAKHIDEDDEDEEDDYQDDEDEDYEDDYDDEDEDYDDDEDYDEKSSHKPVRNKHKKHLPHRHKKKKRPTRVVREVVEDEDDDDYYDSKDVNLKRLKVSKHDTEFEDEDYDDEDDSSKDEDIAQIVKKFKKKNRGKNYDAEALEVINTPSVRTPLTYNIDYDEPHGSYEISNNYPSTSDNYYQNSGTPSYISINLGGGVPGSSNLYLRPNNVGSNVNQPPMNGFNSMVPSNYNPNAYPNMYNPMNPYGMGQPPFPPTVYPNNPGFYNMGYPMNGYMNPMNPMNPMGYPNNGYMNPMNPMNPMGYPNNGYMNPMNGQNGYMNNGYPNGQNNGYMNNQMNNNQMNNGQMNGQNGYQNNGYPNGQNNGYMNNQMNNNQMNNGQMNGQNGYQNNGYPNGQNNGYMNNQMNNNQMNNGQNNGYMNNQMNNNQMNNGQNNGYMNNQMNNNQMNNQMNNSQMNGQNGYQNNDYQNGQNEYQNSTNEQVNNQNNVQNNEQNNTQNSEQVSQTNTPNNSGVSHKSKPGVVTVSIPVEETPKPTNLKNTANKIDNKSSKASDSKEESVEKNTKTGRTKKTEVVKNETKPAKAKKEEKEPVKEEVKTEEVKPEEVKPEEVKAEKEEAKTEKTEEKKEEQIAVVEEKKATRGRPKKTATVDISNGLVISNDEEFDDYVSKADKLMRKKEKSLSADQREKVEKELSIILSAIDVYKNKEN